MAALYSAESERTCRSDQKTKVVPIRVSLSVCNWESGHDRSAGIVKRRAITSADWLHPTGLSVLGKWVCQGSSVSKVGVTRLLSYA